MILLGETAALPSNTLSIMSYNIMDSGFADESGKYDPVGDRVPGNLTNFMASHSHRSSTWSAWLRQQTGAL